jgi:hypothetical protein
MTADAILATLVRINLIASVAILLVLLLGLLVQRWLGARVAYWLWWVFPSPPRRASCRRASESW